MTEKRYTLEQWSSLSLYYSFPEGNLHHSIGKVIARVENDLNSLYNENKQLKKESNILKASNGEYEVALAILEEKNEQLKKELDYIQNSISEHIKHQKTELGQKALKEIIEDYNEWLLGHKRS